MRATDALRRSAVGLEQNRLALLLADGRTTRETAAARLATLSTIASVLPPGCLVMLSSAAGLPSPEMIST